VGLDDQSLRRRVKDEIRTRMRQVRKALPAAVRAERASRIHAALFELAEWKEASSVLVYASMRTEVDTGPVVERARAEGKRVACPRMSDDGAELDPRVWEAGVTPYEQGRLAPEPPPEAHRMPLEQLELVIVPALALDPRGGRIGYGKGYYDRLLARIPQVARVAVAFDFQLLAEIPETEGDERVHVIVTDARVLDCRA
jgi:5-formyltetrahydrofolate cyclo-ligase